VIPRGLGRRAACTAGAVAAAVAVIVLSLAVHAVGEPVPRWEHDVVESATQVTDVIGLPARAVMQLGTIVAAALVAAAVAWATRERAHPLRIMSAALLALVVANRLKRVIDRGRPVDVDVRELQDSSGYPSSHAAVAFATAIVIMTLLPPRWRPLPLVAATIVGLTRMHVGVHYPLDVVGGALIGAAAGLAVLAVSAPAAATPPAATPPVRTGEPGPERPSEHGSGRPPRR
jgi:undecaprenyl-diphosphatase